MHFNTFHHTSSHTSSCTQSYFIYFIHIDTHFVSCHPDAHNLQLCKCYNVFILVFILVLSICIPCYPCVPVPCPYDDPYAQCPHLAAQLPGFRGRGGQLFAPQAASLLGTPGARQTAHVRHRLTVGLTGLTGLGLGICGLFVAPPLVFWGDGWHRHEWNRNQREISRVEPQKLQRLWFVLGVFSLFPYVPELETSWDLRLDRENKDI